MSNDPIDYPVRRYATLRMNGLPAYRLELRIGSLTTGLFAKRADHAPAEWRRWAGWETRDLDNPLPYATEQAALHGPDPASWRAEVGTVFQREVWPREMGRGPASGSRSAG